MTKDEALALMKATITAFGPNDGISLDQKAWSKLHEAIREALSEPQQEPVASLWRQSGTGRTRIVMPDAITDCDARWFKVSDLYVAPQQRKPWVGLTIEEIDQIQHQNWDERWSYFEFAEAIEAKLREKNT